jgi:hypothetical protein
MRKIRLLMGLLVCCFGFGIESVLATDFGDHPDDLYYILGTQTQGDYDYYYGSAQNHVTKVSSGLLIIKNHDSDTLFRTVLVQEGYQESFSFMGFFENETLGIVSVKFKFDYGLMKYVLKYTEILQFDLYGNYLDRISFEEKFTAYNNHGHLMILSRDAAYAPDVVINSFLEMTQMPATIDALGIFEYQYIGEASVNGAEVDSIDLKEPGNYHIEITRGMYQFGFDVILDPLIAGIEEKGIYPKEASVVASGTLFLNDADYPSGTVITTCGHHVLRIEGINGYNLEIRFTITPEVSGVTEGGVYDAGVYIKAEGVLMKLNGEDYQSQSLIDRPGRYELTVSGVNGYVEQYHFTLLPRVVNLTDGDIFTGQYILNFIGTGMLDGRMVEPGTTLTEAKEYIFELWFEESLYGRYRFTLLSAEAVDPSVPIRIPYLEMALGVISLIGLFLVIRKK